MLPKQHRLPASEIKSVMRRGRRVSVGGAQIILAHNTLPVSRFAFVVPMSVDKQAVARNRVRRLVREAVRLALPKIAPGWDGVFFVRKAWTEEFAVVDTSVRELLRRADIV